MTQEELDYLVEKNKLTLKEVSMKKQTAVEFLGHELNVKLFYDISPELWEQVNEIFKQAKAMEKEQIEDAAGIGHFEGMGKAPMSSIEYFEYAVEFYKKHYGS